MPSALSVDDEPWLESRYWEK